jgi:hypothetical protein
MAPSSFDGRPSGFMARAEAIHSYEEVAKTDFFTKAMLASAAAWSPDPQNPPFFMNLPVKDGKVDPLVEAKWAANAPLATIDQYIPELRRLHAIAFDAGTRDEPIVTTVRDLDRVLTAYRIAHTFETYNGNHIDHISERAGTKMLPFFSQNLSFGKNRH